MQRIAARTAPLECLYAAVGRVARVDQAWRARRQQDLLQNVLAVFVEDFEVQRQVATTALVDRRVVPRRLVGSQVRVAGDRSRIAERRRRREVCQRRSRCKPAR